MRVDRHYQGLLLYHCRYRARLDQIDERLTTLPGLRLNGNYMDGVSVRKRIFQGQRLASKIAGALLTAGNDEPLDVHIERLQAYMDQQCP